MIWMTSNGNCFHFDQDHLINAYNDVKKDIVKLIVPDSLRYQIAFLFLKDFENDIHFKIQNHLFVTKMTQTSCKEDLAMKTLTYFPLEHQKAYQTLP